MAYQVEETGANSRKVQVSVPADVYQKEMNKSLRKLSKRVKLSGFRKGSIPLSVMQRQYGEQVRPEVLDELLRKNIDEVLGQTEQVIHMAQPSIKTLPSKQSPFEFEVQIETRPKLDPVGYMGLEVEKPTPDISDEQVDEALEALRVEHAILQPIPRRKTVREGDFITLDFRALGDDEAVQQLSGDDVEIEVGSGQSLPGIEEALVGAKFNTTVTTTISLPENFPVEELRDRDVELEIEIKDAKQRILPELDDEFAADTGKAETLEALRETLRTELAQDLEHQAQHLAEDNLVTTLLDQNTFELPPLFLAEQIEGALASEFQRMTGQQVDPRMLAGNEAFDPMREDLRERVSRQIRAEFVLMAIAEKEGIKVNEEDFKTYCQHQSLHMNVEASMLERYFRQDQDRMQQALGSAMLEKTLTHLLGEATIKEVAWPEPEADSEDAAALGEEE